MRATTSLKRRLREPKILVAPGAYDCLTAKIIERSHFEAVYMTGAGTSVAKLGVPDLGIATLADMAANAAAIAAAVEVPLIADADTGYGGRREIARTIRKYESAGVAALHLEDQEFPKRCGHLEGKQLVSAEKMAERLRAAVDARTDPDLVIIARTDALGVTGIDDAFRRCEAYLKAGADALFVEAIPSAFVAERLARSFDVPLVYNFVETGKSPLLRASELERLGFRIVLFPASALLAVHKVVEELMRDLRRDGTTAGWLRRMKTLRESFELVGLSEHLKRQKEK